MRVTLILLALAAMPGPCAAQSGVPVAVGGLPDMDACGTTADVVGLDPQGDNFLAVRSGPGTSYVMVDQLRTSEVVTVCEEGGDYGVGGWFGIVYGPVDCGVAAPITPRQAYGGPCRSGWVWGEYLRPLAG